MAKAREEVKPEAETVGWESCMIEPAKPRIPAGKKLCPVVKYTASNGILGFLFDGVPVQINVAKGLNIGKTVMISYVGDLSTHIEFSLAKK